MAFPVFDARFKILDELLVFLRTARLVHAVGDAPNDRERIDQISALQLRRMLEQLLEEKGVFTDTLDGLDEVRRQLVRRLKVSRLGRGNLRQRREGTALVVDVVQGMCIVRTEQIVHGEVVFECAENAAQELLVRGFLGILLQTDKKAPLGVHELVQITKDVVQCVLRHEIILRERRCIGLQDLEIADVLSLGLEQLAANEFALIRRCRAYELLGRIVRMRRVKVHEAALFQQRDETVDGAHDAHEAVRVVEIQLRHSKGIVGIPS